MQAITNILASIMCLAALSAHSAGIDARATPIPTGTLIDANGKKMGVFFPAPVNPNVSPLGLITVAGTPIFVRLDQYIHNYAGPNQWTDNQLLVAFSIQATDRVYFTSTNCTGTPYITSAAFPSAGAVPSTVITDVNGNATAYLSKGGQPPTMMSVASYIMALDVGCVTQPSTGLFYPASQTVQLSDLYAVPYSVK